MQLPGTCKIDRTQCKLAYAVVPIVQRREGLRSSTEKLAQTFPGITENNSCNNIHE